MSGPTRGFTTALVQDSIPAPTRGAGAKLKLDKSTSVNAEFSRHGDTAAKLGRVVRDGIKGNMLMGF
jgi:hypothetical protein